MYVSSRKAAKELGLHANTLRKWAKNGAIKHIITASGQRKYDIDSYLGKTYECITVCYCRVSSYKQKDDLCRQVEFMRSKYPKSEIIKDIGSGINFKRKGLSAILERAMSGDKLEVVVAHKDRLARFGFELIRYIIERSGGKLVVLSQTVFSPEDELTKDLLSILHVFSCRMHGLRNYKKQVSEALSHKRTEKDR